MTDAPSQEDRKTVERTRPPLTDRQITAIGKVAAEWSMAENILEHMIWVLIPVDQETGRRNYPPPFAAGPDR